MSDLLHTGRECYARRAWSAAYQGLLSADQATPLAAEDLERLATASYLIGRDLEFQRLLERLHRIQVEAGHPERAARSAFWLALTFLFRGERGQSDAWIARGERLVENRECAESGYLLLVVAEQQLRGRKLEAGHATAITAGAIGDRCLDADLTAGARHAQGRALIQLGEVLAGLRLLDETMLAVVAGELSPIMTALMYCSVIDACHQVYALGRAREWTAAFSRVCAQEPEMFAFTGTCLVHRAEILQFHGAWPDALAEAGQACERSARADRKPPAAAWYRQAEIHRLRGDFDQAEEAYRAASQLGCEPQPGLALLRLAQGRPDAACAAIQRLVSSATDRLERARLLPAQLEVTIAMNDLEGARGAADEVWRLADLFDSDVLRATAGQASGAIALAEGDARAALDPLRGAFQTWERLEAPYEAARVRVLIGQACRALGDDDTGELEWDAAKATFERLGASPDLARLRSAETRVTPRRESPLTARETQVLRLISSGHTNKEIAARLCLSERTIDRHVSNILGKLDVPSRAAATAYAYDHDLF